VEPITPPRLFNLLLYATTRTNALRMFEAADLTISTCILCSCAMGQTDSKQDPAPQIQAMLENQDAATAMPKGPTG